MADLSQERISQLHDVFAMFDTNNDGFINMTEMKEILLSIGKGASDEEARQVFKKFDLDGTWTKSIDFPEFINVVGKNPTLWDPITEPKMLQLFRLFDKDGDGFITHEEVKLAMKQDGQTITDEEVGEMILAADTDGDGRLTYTEFEAVMTDTHGQQ